MKYFSAFLERKDRENKDHLRTLGKVLGKAGFDVKDHLDHHGSPYLYVKKPADYDPIIEALEFGGIRVYSHGRETISFRPQNKESVEPFGIAYLLDVKGMYKNLVTEKEDTDMGMDLVRYLVEEVLNFFMRSAKCQQSDKIDIDDEDTLGRVIGPSDGNRNDPTVTSADGTKGI